MPEFDKAYEALVAAETAFAWECEKIYGRRAFGNCGRSHRDTPKLAKLRKALEKATAAYHLAWKAIGTGTGSQDDAALWDGIAASQPGEKFLH